MREALEASLMVGVAAGCLLAGFRLVVGVLVVLMRGACD